MGKTLDCVSRFPLNFFRALPLRACFTTEQSTVEASLFVNERMMGTILEIARAYGLRPRLWLLSQIDFTALTGIGRKLCSHNLD